MQRWRSAATVMRGLSVQMPTIIIRFSGVSMRSQAVSTLLMRSTGIPIVNPSLTPFRPAPILSLTSSAPPHLFAKGDTVSLQKKFDKAVADSKQLSERPDNATLLKLYALFKQASEGDNETKKPGMMDMVGRAKWQAWEEIKGLGSEEAMQEYIDLIESLK
jgi:diazepam-binding inhibitor (GABA receptor modulating acyl-CoA-binding protein)